MDLSCPDNLPGGIEVAPGVFVAGEAMRWQFSRSGGPGGQNVNKLNTKAELWIGINSFVGLSGDALARLRNLAGRRLTKEDQIHIVAEVNRTQEANRQTVLDILRQLLVQARHRPKTRRPTRPTRASRQRRVAGKRIRSEIKSTRRRPGMDE
jgi:ribosome-associated protein